MQDSPPGPSTHRLVTKKCVCDPSPNRRRSGALSSPLPHNGWVARSIYLLPFVLCAALLLACSGDDNNDAAATLEPQLEPRELLARSVEAVRDAETFHFRLTHRNGSTPLPLNLQLDTAEGDFQIPGRLSADVRARATGGVTVSVQVIAIDDRTWITNPFTRSWQRLPGASLSDLADPSALILSLLPQVEDARYGEETSIDGTRTVKVEGSIDSGALQESLAFARPGNTIRVEAWIGVSDSYPRRIVLSGPLAANDNDNVVRQVDLSNFGRQVQINPP
jgi:hypothetical protein